MKDDFLSMMKPSNMRIFAVSKYWSDV